MPGTSPKKAALSGSTANQTVKVPVGLLKRLKHFCVDADMTQNSVILLAIAEYLDRMKA